MEQAYYQFINQWYEKKKWKQYDFQQHLAQAYFEGYHGLLNAPTGSGKTYAIWLPIISAALAKNADEKTNRLNKKKSSFNKVSNNQTEIPFINEEKTHLESSLKVLWISPLRALAKDICTALQDACNVMKLNWRVELRTGDISSAKKQQQKKQMPDCLVITPESLHVLFCSKNYKELFQHLDCIIVDEWHELLGSKRGVQVELAISHLKHLSKNTLRIWGISATIGNLVEAMEILLGNDIAEEKSIIIRTENKKEISVNTVLPQTIDVLPWSGHIGLSLLPQIADIIQKSTTTLVFTNTRAMAEIWYHHLLNFNEDFAGLIAMHHGSLSTEVRDWVEENLHQGNLKAVICTSSLDLGVDFRPVDTVIQIGSPKGVARFTQRAGRSGHQPGALSNIYFIPTHAMELVEISAIKEAITSDIIEKREPQILCFDVLVQYLVTLSISEGFEDKEILKQILSSHAFYLMNDAEWKWILSFLTEGGNAFNAYDEFNKLGIADGKYRIKQKKAAIKHRLQIGTIVSDPVIRISYLKGGSLGTVEEYFIASLKPGDVFWFAGNCLEFIMLKDLTAYVRKTSEQKAITASYMGGRMPLSSSLAELMRKQLELASKQTIDTPEYTMLKPLLDLQKERSCIPTTSEMLVELHEDQDGFHIFFYPFEGRVVHEVMSGLVAFRLGEKIQMSISSAMNDYGFELLCNKSIDVNEALIRKLFDIREMEKDLFNSVNATEMARRKFRDISIISGLVFTGYPGEQKKSKHLQSSSQLLFDVLREYEPTNLLLKQAYNEILYDQMENARMRSALLRIQKSTIIIKTTNKYSPFAFPIVVDSLSRNKLSSEKISDRIRQMLKENSAN